MKKTITFLACLMCSTFFAFSQGLPELMYFKFDQITGNLTPNAAPPATRAGTADAVVTGLTIGGTGQFGTGLQGNAGATASNRVDPAWTGTHTGDFTISLWLNVPPPASTRYFFGNTTGGGTFRCFTGGVANDGIRLTGGTPSLTLDVASIQPGPVVITYVYNSSAGTITAYKNGVLEVSGPAPSNFTITGTNFVVGSQGTSVEGTMDEFRFYNRALTASEVFLVWDKELPYSPGPNDAGVASLTEPTDFCPGTHDIKVRVKNYGNNILSSAQVHWTLNGVAQTPVTMNVPLDTLGSSGTNETTVTLGSHAFTSAPVDLKAWTEMPNNVPDTSNLNDTLHVTLQASLSGTFTINPALPAGSGNYQSFTDFANDLNAHGVCGPVVANVAPGTYNEFVSFGNINGSSATNTIRINGNGATVQFANTTNDRQLLILSGTKYLTIDSLTFKALSTDFGWGALITNGAEYDSIINCTFDLSMVTTTSSVNSNGITISGSSTSATTLGTNGSNCYIGNNHIKAGTAAGGVYYAITNVGTSDSNVFANNVLENYYMYGVYINGSSGTKILNNEMTRATKTSVTTFYGIYTTGVTPGIEIVGNRIHNPGGTAGSTGTMYGIYALGDGTTTEPGLIANNLLYNLDQGGIVYGIYLSTAPYVNVYHNTVVIDQVLNSASANYGIYAAGTNTDVNIKNNNVVITAGGTGTKYGFYYSTAASISDAQKNNFYVNSSQAGTQNYGYYTTAYATQAAFQAAYPGLEVGSPATDPQFTNPSTGNFNVQNAQLIAGGENLTAWVPTDINGQPRSGAPTIGAFEQAPSGSNNAGMLELLSPTGMYCAGQQQVTATIFNAGVNNITNLQVHWTVNGVAQTPVNYTGTLTPVTAPGGQSIDTVVLGTANFPNSTPTVIKAWTSLPNGQPDPDNSNDTVQASFQATDFYVSAISDSICLGSTGVIQLYPNSGYQPGSIAWQSSNNGTSWTTITGAATTQHEEANMTADKYFRAQISDGGSTCSTDSVKIHVLQVSAPTPIGGERCGPGTVTLSATTSPGASLYWWNAATGGVPLATAPQFTTPSISTTTDYWVSAGYGGMPDSIAIPLTTGTTIGSYHHMFLVKTIPGGDLDKIAIKCNNTAGTLTDWDIYYRPDNYQNVPGANTSSAGWTLLSSTTNVPSLGSNEYTVIASGLGLTMPANSTYSIYIAPGAGTTHQYSTPTIGTVAASTATLELIAGNRGTSLFNATTTGGMATVKISFSSGCQSARQPVTATVKDLPSVQLGNDTALCPGSSLTLNAGNTGATFLWNDNSTGQTKTVTTPGTYSVKVTNSQSCSNSDTVVVSAGQVPTNTLGATYDLCEGDTLSLNAGNAGSTYAWTTSDTTQSIEVTAAGPYGVTITSPDGCPLTANTTVTSRPVPVVNLGNDTAICSGAGLTLDAGNAGMDYLWSTGATTQTVNVTNTGTYSVTVTSPYNCVGTDQITITTMPAPTVDAFSSIDLSNEAPGKVQFTAVNPQNVTGYEWDFGDGSPVSNAVSPTHVYTANGTYSVQLKVTNDCGEHTVTLSINIQTVGVRMPEGDRANFELYPNPGSHQVTIVNNSDHAHMQSITIVNVLGATVLETKTTSGKAQTINISGLASGIYSARIQTDKGVVIKKFEIVR